MQAIYLEAADRVRRGWTQQSYARDRKGLTVLPADRSATCWCLAGALFANGRLKGAARLQIFDQLAKLVPAVPNRSSQSALLNWNDQPERTQAEVVALLERAAAGASA